MNKFIVLHWDYESRFKEKGSIPLYIDPSQVTFVRESIADKENTCIMFSNGTSLVVVENVHEVIRKVWGVN